jgi:hypothetical protein
MAVQTVVLDMRGKGKRKLEMRNRGLSSILSKEALPERQQQHADTIVIKFLSSDGELIPEVILP